MNRYRLGNSDYEYTVDTFFLHESTFTQDEFADMCTKCIRSATIEYFTTNPMIVYSTVDNDALNITNYGGEDVYVDSTSSLDKDVSYHMTRIIELMKSEYGFVLEVLPESTAGFHINDYEFMTDFYQTEIVPKILERCEKNDIPVINDYETERLLNDLVHECKSIEEAMHKFNEWKANYKLNS